MNKLSKDPIDQFFKEALKSPDLKYNKQDWKGLEARLPRKSKNKTFAWLLPAAAALLIFVSLWLRDGSKPDNKSGSKTDIESALKDSQTTGIDRAPKYASNDTLAKRSSVPSVSNSFGVLRPSATFAASKQISNNLYFTTPKQIAGYNNSDYSGLSAQLVVLSEKLSVPNNEFTNPEISNVNILSPLNKPTNKAIEKKAREKVNGSVSLAFSFSPDINSVNHFATNDVGASIGAGVSYKINKHLSLQGAIGYSRKAYSASPYEYKAPWSNSNAAKYAESIDADCRVLDVPLSLRYTFESSPKTAFFISGGLSSYFMLEETYTLVGKPQPGYPTNTDPSYSYKNENTHPLSVANFSAGISKRLNKQTSVVIQPYVKLPLTGIGQGKVNLQSTGIIFQLEYNLTKKEKVSPSGAVQ